MKNTILILTTDYPNSEGYVASYFVHSRNLYYAKEGLDILVLNFKAKKNDIVDGIKVITLKYFEDKYRNHKFPLLISHAPNLRNHYRFLTKYKKNFEHLLFFFHGHEVLIQSEVYPEPYDYVLKKNKLIYNIQDYYDRFKLKVWSSFFNKNINSLDFVFVSEWMEEKFLQYINIDKMKNEKKFHVIYNCIGETFINNKYSKDIHKKYDFITIRNMLDKSKYAIDIVAKLAKDNPDKTFCVIGKGDYFKYYKKPLNLILIEKHLSHQEVIEYLNVSRAALMPTRADAQGVMMCEMASFGIPLITSSIPVCKMVLKGFENVAFIDNENPILNNIDNILNNEVSSINRLRFSKENTIAKEINLIERIINKKA